MGGPNGAGERVPPTHGRWVRALLTADAWRALLPRLRGRVQLWKCGIANVKQRETAVIIRLERRDNKTNQQCFSQFSIPFITHLPEPPQLAD